MGTSNEANREFGELGAREGTVESEIERADRIVSEIDRERTEAAPLARPTPPPTLAAMSKAAFVERAKAFQKHPTVERVDLPWLGAGEHAFVKGMTAGERDDFEASLVVRDDKGGETDRVSSKNIRAKFLLRCLCDKEGVRLFADHEERLLSGLDAKTADALYEKGRNMSGVTKADIEEMEKNSARARSGAISFSLDSKNSDASPTS